jgi:hypothetical protein
MHLSALGVVLLSTVWIMTGGAARAQQPPDASPHHAEGQYGQGHTENHDWYQELKQPGTGYSCCNGRNASSEGDCRPTRAYLSDDGMWYAMIDGRWVPIPPSVVLRQLAPDGRSHVCASKTGKIYCFLGGSPKS